ncbi:MAG: FKBP-type peptidyl-prolyl cis-trans isomerase [Thermoplasmata archaeon]
MTSKTAGDDGVTHAGDIVRLDFELWSEIGGKSELLDTTREEVARQAGGEMAEGASWGPRPHQIGGEFFPAGIENSLLGLKIGEEAAREFAPAEAFGERDPDLIELFSMHEIERLPEMRKKDAHLDLGTVLTIEGRRGRVVTLTAARVRVDFNPPFAGRRIRGKFRVTERIDEPAEQVRAIVELQYGRSAEFHIETHEKTISLKIPDRSKFDIGWMAAKPRVIDRIRSQVKPQTIRVVEEYITPVVEPKAHEKAAKPGAEGAPPAPTATPATDETPPKPGGDSKPAGRHPAHPKKAD